MKAKILIQVVAIIVIILALASLTIPSTKEIHHKTTIQAVPEKVFSYIQELRNWNQWYPNLKNANIEYSNTTNLKGSFIKWKSKSGMTGKITIAEYITNKEIRFDIEKKDTAKKTLIFALQSADGGTLTECRSEINIGSDPLKKYISLFDEGQDKDEVMNLIIGLKDAFEKSIKDTISIVPVDKDKIAPDQSHQDNLNKPLIESHNKTDDSSKQKKRNDVYQTYD